AFELVAQTVDDVLVLTCRGLQGVVESVVEFEDISHQRRGFAGGRDGYRRPVVAGHRAQVEHGAVWQFKCRLATHRDDAVGADAAGSIVEHFFLVDLHVHAVHSHRAYPAFNHAGRDAGLPGQVRIITDP